MSNSKYENSNMTTGSNYPIAWQSEIVKFFNSQPWELRKEIILSERTYQIDNIWRCSIMPDDEFTFD